MQDSTVAAKLRTGGAVILGKTNLSEWANFRSFESVSGWSGRGGQTNNPYGIARNPCGSSSGSGAAVSANFAAVSFGTETDGSIVCPANANGVVGLKPTVGLTSRAGIVPISHTQDTFGPHGRHVADVAVALGVVQSRFYDGRDPATAGVPLGWQGTGKTRPTNIPTDYTQFLNPNGLQGARLGLTRIGLTGFDQRDNAPMGARRLRSGIRGTDRMRAQPSSTWMPRASYGPMAAEDRVSSWCCAMSSARTCRRTSQRARACRLPAVLWQTPSPSTTLTPTSRCRTSTRTSGSCANRWRLGPTIRSPHFGGMTYNQALAADHDFGVNGIDAALSQFNLDAVVTATDNPAWSTDLIFGDHFIFGTSGLAAPEGYPIIQVPAAMVYRGANGNQLLRHGIQRAHVDQAGFRLRSLHPDAGEQSTNVCADGAIRPHSGYDVESIEEPEGAAGEREASGSGERHAQSAKQGAKGPASFVRSRNT